MIGVFRRNRWQKHCTLFIFGVMSFHPVSYVFQLSIDIHVLATRLDFYIIFAVSNMFLKITRFSFFFKFR